LNDYVSDFLRVIFASDSATLRYYPPMENFLGSHLRHRIGAQDSTAAGRGKSRIRTLPWIVILSFGLTLTAAQKADTPPLSNDGLTSEQIAIYRAVLIDYLKDSKGWINLSQKTVPLHLEGPTATGGCKPGFDLESYNLARHQVDAKVAKGLSVTLVDPVVQEALLNKNNALNPADSEKHGYQNGLFTLTEMSFDTDHHRAVVGYTFVCGDQCGHGETLILEKSGGKWKITSMCGEWVS
jgi:hypothetical protein